MNLREDEQGSASGKYKIPMLREIIEERKTKAIETLTVSYAKNRLPLEEYERLVEYINKIESERELAVVEKITAEYRDPEKTDADEYDDEDEQDYRGYHPGYNHGYNPMSRNILNVFSSRIVSGPVKSESQYVNVMGSTVIKIRKMDLAKRRTELNVFSFMGESVILVEPGINVTINVIPILGGASINRKVKKSVEDRAPELVITGSVVLGSVSVKLLKDQQ